MQVALDWASFHIFACSSPFKFSSFLLIQERFFSLLNVKFQGFKHPGEQSVLIITSCGSYQSNHFSIQHSLSTLNRCLLTIVTEEIPCKFNLHTETAEIRNGMISSPSFIQVSLHQLAVSSPSNWLSITLNFHKCIGIDRAWAPNLRHQRQDS